MFTGTVAVTLVDDVLGPGAGPGAIAFHPDVFRPDLLQFQCPCGCRAIGAVRLTGSHPWRWNDSTLKPTVHPSIALHTDDSSIPHWHGYLVRGEFRDKPPTETDW